MVSKKFKTRGGGTKLTVDDRAVTMTGGCLQKTVRIPLQSIAAVVTQMDTLVIETKGGQKYSIDVRRAPQVADYILGVIPKQ